MEVVYLLYSTDAHHSRVSFNLIGVFSEHHRAVRGAKEFDGHNHLTLQDLGNLDRINQTQGLEINYLIERRIIDEIS